MPLQYSHYTSDKYQIQLQYPSEWTIHEKTNRFVEGPDTLISNIGAGQIGISYASDLLKNFGTVDVQSAVIAFHKSLTTDYTHDYRTIENPSFINIDNQRSGTFLITMKDKYETNSITNVVQYWFTIVGNTGYLIYFISTPEKFDNPENTEIRDHFIKSIKFLGTNNLTR